jgi:lipid II:glycine glycyltransferase (peptidoglycan interpeptide bridge formation enzyme)
LEVKAVEEVYTFFINEYKNEKWDNLLNLFDDATLYQSWHYVSYRIKNGYACSFVMKSSDSVVAAALVRIEKIPLLNIGIAFISFGPMWRLRGEDINLKKLLVFIKALRKEFSIKRNLYLRIKPHVYNNSDWFLEYKQQFVNEQFVCRTNDDFTLILDLLPDIDTIRMKLHPKWRNLLNNAEKNNFLIRDDSPEKLIQTFKSLYNEMLKRKAYDTNVNLNAYVNAIEKLPEELCPKIVIAEIDGIPMAGAVISKNGNTGIYCLGATGNLGINNNSSYFVQWHVIKYLKSIGIRYYDLGGCSPKKVPSTFHFKARICGKDPIVLQRVGIMNVCDNILTNKIISSMEKIVTIFLSLKNLIKIKIEK